MLAPGPEERTDLDADDESLPVFQDLLARFGSTYRVPARTRAGDGLVIHDPEDIRRVLLANRGNYVKGAGIDRVRMLLGNGLIASDGEFWARQRRLIQPAFNGATMRSLQPLVERVNIDLAARWSDRAAHGGNADLSVELSEVALSIVLQVLFSNDLGRLVAAEGHNPFDMLTSSSTRDLRFAAKFRALTRFVREMIAARRAEGRHEGDLLTMMMDARDKEGGEPMSDRALVDEAMTLIVAGHETTASTLAWTWYLLSQNPAVEARLHAALDAPALAGASQPADAEALAERILQESLRLYPPVWVFSRRALADDRLGGFDVPAGTDVFICPYLLHRLPAHWPDPETFDPDRFLPAASAARHRFAFLPFSAGPRHCIGSGFAMSEMATHLMLLARRLRLHYEDGAAPEAEFHINLRTREPLRMRLETR